MLVHSQLLPQLARLLLLAADTFLLVQPSQAEQIARRQPFVENYNQGGSQPWTRRAEQERRAVQEPIAVRKMMDNEGEMFFQDYWQFDQEADDSAASQPEPTSSKLRPKTYSHALDPADRWTNASLLLPFQAPFALHRDFDSPPSISHWARALLPQLHDRAFHCPTDTDACTSIDRPNSCCPSGSSCQLVTDSGQGDVACCGSGQTCAGNVQDCAAGYTNCPGAAGGGCCVPGYACIGTIGCKCLFRPATQSMQSKDFLPDGHLSPNRRPQLHHNRRPKPSSHRLPLFLLSFLSRVGNFHPN